MAAASCIQEDKEAGDPGDAIAQGAEARRSGHVATRAFKASEGFFFFPPVKQRVEHRLEQMGRPQGPRLHTAHVLCMDAILNVGLEMGSHNHECWPHVFR